MRVKQTKTKGENMSKYLIEVLVNDKPITTYNASPNGDIFVEGRPGSPYKIKITNNTYGRVKAVVSVDGLSVLDGKPASHQGKGYIIAGYSSLVIDGWRVSDTTVNQFIFGSKKNSYAAKSGQSVANSGVIGAVIFEEVISYPYWTTLVLGPSVHDTYYDKPWYSTSIQAKSTFDSGRVTRSTSGFGASMHADTLSVGASMNNVGSNAVAASAAPLNNMATGFGEAVNSPVREVTFTSAATHTLLAIYYDDRRGLEARGIIVDRRLQRPDPFPKSNTGYCRPV